MFYAENIDYIEDQPEHDSTYASIDGNTTLSKDVQSEQLGQFVTFSCDDFCKLVEELYRNADNGSVPLKPNELIFFLDMLFEIDNKLDNEDIINRLKSYYFHMDIIKNIISEKKYLLVPVDVLTPNNYIQQGEPEVCLDYIEEKFLCDRPYASKFIEDIIQEVHGADNNEILEEKLMAWITLPFKYLIQKNASDILRITLKNSVKKALNTSFDKNLGSALIWKFLSMDNKDIRISMDNLTAQNYDIQTTSAVNGMDFIVIYDSLLPLVSELRQKLDVDIISLQENIVLNWHRVRHLLLEITKLKKCIKTELDPDYGPMHSFINKHSEDFRTFKEFVVGYKDILIKKYKNIQQPKSMNLSVQRDLGEALAEYLKRYNITFKNFCKVVVLEKLENTVFAIKTFVESFSNVFRESRTNVYHIELKEKLLDIYQCYTVWKDTVFGVIHKRVEELVCTTYNIEYDYKNMCSNEADASLFLSKLPGKISDIYPHSLELHEEIRKEISNFTEKYDPILEVANFLKYHVQLAQEREISLVKEFFSRFMFDDMYSELIKRIRTSLNLFHEKVATVLEVISYKLYCSLRTKAKSSDEFSRSTETQESGVAKSKLHISLEVGKKPINNGKSEPHNENVENDPNEDRQNYLYLSRKWDKNIICVEIRRRQKAPIPVYGSSIPPPNIDIMVKNLMLSKNGFKRLNTQDTALKFAGKFLKGANPDSQIENIISPQSEGMDVRGDDGTELLQVLNDGFAQSGGAHTMESNFRAEDFEETINYKDQLEDSHTAVNSGSSSSRCSNISRFYQDYTLQNVNKGELCDSDLQSLICALAERIDKTGTQLQILSKEFDNLKSITLLLLNSLSAQNKF